MRVKFLWLTGVGLSQSIFFVPSLEEPYNAPQPGKFMANAHAGAQRLGCLDVRFCEEHNVSHDLQKEPIMFLRKLLFILSVSLIFIAGTVFAQTDTATHDVTMNVAAIAMIEVNAGTIVLNTNAPLAGGDPVTGDADTTKYLQYTALNAAGTARTITAEWNILDAAPAGTSLDVVAAVPAGMGTTGGPITFVNLNATAHAIVVNIPSCATGVAETDGANLTFTFNIDTVASLVVGDSHTVTIIYTLTEDV